jgi:hypothetical protein
MSKTTKRDIAKLAKLRVNELQAKFAEVVGETTRSPNKTYLIRRISEALEAADEADRAAQAASPAPTPEEPEEAAPPATVAATEPEPEQPDQPDPDAEQTEPAGGVEKLTKLSVPALQAKYVEVVGRETASSNRLYLLWKIREAQKGRVPVGPRRNTRREGVAFKVLPLRMEADLVEQLDAAWRRLGLPSRMELIRRALQAYLANSGETEVAARLANEG